MKHTVAGSNVGARSPKNKNEQILFLSSFNKGQEKKKTKFSKIYQRILALVKIL